MRAHYLRTLVFAAALSALTVAIIFLSISRPRAAEADLYCWSESDRKFYPCGGTQTPLPLIPMSQYPRGAVPVAASSGNVAASAAVATLAGAAGKTTYICGFRMTGLGATVLATVNATVAGLVGSVTLTYTFQAPLGVTVSATPLGDQFNPCIPASAQNTAIVVTLPSLGTGNTNAAASAWGYQL